MLKNNFFVILCLLFAGEAFAQQPIAGVVFEVNERNAKVPLPGVNLVWLGTSVGATTDREGHFSLKRSEATNRLVISHVGYAPDTIDVKGEAFLEITLNETRLLNEVSIAFREMPTSQNPLEPLNSKTMSEQELFKAACCNLSESFETNPSVDVSFTDAITGTRQIEMLGLASVYTQKTIENMPAIRGLAAIEGLTYVPGSWINSIQVTKGTGSVINGYESMAGQINVEMKKPEDSEKLYANAYLNESGRLEMNLNTTRQVGESVATTTLLHTLLQPFEIDRNEDGFMDHPTGRHFIALNRWKFITATGWEGQAGIKGTLMDTQAGQLEDVGGASPYEVAMQTNRLEMWAKTGYVFLSKPYQSVGLQLSGVLHDQDATFGAKGYGGNEKAFYANLIFQSIIGNPDHTYKTGFSYLYNDFDENLNDRRFARTESVPGVFVEYAYSSEKFNLIAGLRADNHNLYGLFVTPRLHARYGLSDRTTLRASVGRGFRSPNIFSENFGMLISSRDIAIESGNTKGAYGLDPEIAWNGGINFTHEFQLNYRQGSFALDFYRTQFEKQVIADQEADAGLISFYNLAGDSYSNSFQAELNYEALKLFDVRLAYRSYDVKATYRDALKQRPLLAKNRAFLNLAYSGLRNWLFDYTLQWVGQKRLPDISGNAADYRLPSFSPDFYLMNAQVTRSLGKAQIYLGAENLLDYKQGNPILGADDPYGPYFDSSLIWGPVFGRTIYVGVRYKIE